MDQVQSLRSNTGLIQQQLHTLSNLPMTVKDHFFPSYTDYSSTEAALNSCECSPCGVDTVSNPNDLVSLAWLQKGDIIQIAPLDGEEEHQNGLESSSASLSSLKSDEYVGFRTSVPDFSPFSLPSNAPPRTSTQTTTTFSRPSSADYGSLQCRVESPQLPSASHLAQTNQGLTKPNYSYTHLIFMAIESTPQKCMTVNQIYNWCESNFPFYKHAGAGWKNSLRHNLSINKSFKRLPRDSRGPGRGAFWTVEPRERSTLLDAIKRNPWNFNNMAALFSAHPDPAGRASVPVPDFSNPQVFGMRRFGLSQSAPGHVFRTEGMGQFGLHFDQMGNLTDPSSGSALRFLPTLDGHLVASFSNDFQDGPLDSRMGDGDFDGLSLPHDDFYMSEHSAPRAEGASVPFDWSAEDEEKYRSTLRLLMETVTSGSEEGNKDGTAESRPCGAKQDNVDVTISADDGKLVTKQRRKSRLQPTRVVEDTYVYPGGLHSMGTCNECKENAAAGCEACSEKRLRYLLDPLAKASFQERALEDVANALDSDQEQGPAGGPAVKKPLRKTANAKSDVSVRTGALKSDDPESTAKVSNVETEEVYVTPAPYIDHEYSHCQAQLRGPEDNRVVNRYNENYCTEMMRRLTRSRPYLRRSSNTGFRTKGSGKPIDKHDEQPYKYVENDHNFHDPDDFSDGERDEFPEHRDPRETGVFKLRECSRKRGRYRRRRGTPRAPKIYSENRLALPSRGKRRFLRTAPRRRRGRRPLLGASDAVATDNGSRRSGRSPKIPKRPYEDFEDSFSVEGGDPDNFPTGTNDTVEGIDCTPKIRQESRNSLDAPGYYGSDDLRKSNRRGRKRGRKRGWNGRYANRHVVRSDSEYDDYYCSENSTDEDEEARYLKLACKRQRVICNARQDVAGSHSPHLYDPGYFYSKTERTALNTAYFHPTLNGKSTHPRNVGPLWGQSRMRLISNLAPMAWSIGMQEDMDSEEELLSASDALDEDVDDCEEIVIEESELPSKNEPATVEAAQLLLGISQMQSFRRQSGYLSLDSSGTSASLLVDTPPSPATGSPTKTNEEKSTPNSPQGSAPATSSSPIPSIV